MKRLVPLLTLALTAPSAMASSPNEIWSYQDSTGTSLAQACNNKSTCELILQKQPLHCLGKQPLPNRLCHWRPAGLPNTPVAALRNWIPAPAAPRPVLRSTLTIG